MAKEQSVKTRVSSKHAGRSSPVKKIGKPPPDSTGIKAKQSQATLKKRGASVRSKVSDNPKDERRMALRQAITALSNGHDDRLYELISEACKEGQLLRNVGSAWTDFIHRSNWKNPRMAPRKDASRDATFHLLKWLFQDVQDGNKTASLYWRAVQHIADEEPKNIYTELKKHGVRRLAQMNAKSRQTSKPVTETEQENRVKLGELWIIDEAADFLGEDDNASFQLLVTRERTKPVPIYILERAKGMKDAKK